MNQCVTTLDSWLLQLSVALSKILCSKDETRGLPLVERGKYTLRSRGRCGVQWGVQCSAAVSDSFVTSRSRNSFHVENVEWTWGSSSTVAVRRPQKDVPTLPIGHYNFIYTVTVVRNSDLKTFLRWNLWPKKGFAVLLQVLSLFCHHGKYNRFCHEGEYEGAGGDSSCYAKKHGEPLELYKESITHSWSHVLQFIL